VAVLNNKQGFQDCEEYAGLDAWLGEVANQYWEDNYDTLQVVHPQLIFFRILTMCS
jgi:hypothetical protein